LAENGNTRDNSFQTPDGRVIEQTELVIRQFEGVTEASS